MEIDWRDARFMAIVAATNSHVFNFTGDGYVAAFGNHFKASLIQLRLLCEH